MSSTTERSATEVKALSLLGQGISAVLVASTLGISESRVSQLLSDETFANEVRELRFAALAKHNERDAAADTIESALLGQLKDAIPLLMRPMEIARVLGTVNALKRRGASSPETMHERSAIVTITMPKQITQKFVTNINNQVIKAGTQELITIQSGSMDALISAGRNTTVETDVPEISQE